MLGYGPQSPAPRVMLQFFPTRKIELTVIFSQNTRQMVFSYIFVLHFTLKLI